MGICWYCYWGWPKPVADIYEKASEAIGESPLHFGPAHVVWEDENFETEHIQFCLDHMDEYRHELSDGEMEVVRESLVALLAVPESIRCCEPNDYDEEHPENYPPPEGLEMVRV